MAWKILDKVKKIGRNIDDQARGDLRDIEDATRSFVDNPAQEVASMFLPESADKYMDKMIRDPESIFRPEFGAPQMERQNELMQRAALANRMPTTDDARREQDYMNQTRRRRGRAAAMLSQASGQQPNTVFTPSAGAGSRTLLG